MDRFPQRWIAARKQYIHALGGGAFGETHLTVKGITLGARLSN